MEEQIKTALATSIAWWQSCRDAIDDRVEAIDAIRRALVQQDESLKAAISGAETLLSAAEKIGPPPPVCEEEVADTEARIRRALGYTALEARLVKACEVIDYLEADVSKVICEILQEEYRSGDEIVAWLRKILAESKERMRLPELPPTAGNRVPTVK